MWNLGGELPEGGDREAGARETDLEIKRKLRRRLALKKTLGEGAFSAERKLLRTTKRRGGAVARKFAEKNRRGYPLVHLCDGIRVESTNGRIVGHPESKGGADIRDPADPPSDMEAWGRTCKRAAECSNEAWQRMREKPPTGACEDLNIPSENPKMPCCHHCPYYYECEEKNDCCPECPYYSREGCLYSEEEEELLG